MRTVKRDDLCKKFFQSFQRTICGVADCSAVNTFFAGDIRVLSSFKIDLANEVLLSGRELGNSGMQSSVFILDGNFRFDIVIRGKQRIVQVERVQRAVSAGFLVVDIVLLPVQVNDDVGIFLGNFDFDGLGCKCILDFHKNSSVLISRNGGIRYSCFGHSERTAVQTEFSVSDCSNPLKRQLQYLLVPPDIVEPSAIR
nr:MAG TPA: hypothetical protein [Caudoviricetes sp.]